MTKRNKVGLIYLVVIISTLLVRISAGLNISDTLGIDSDIWFSIFMQIFCFGLLPFVLYKIIPEDNQIVQTSTLLSDFGFHKLSFKNFILVIIIGVSMMVVTVVLNVIWNLLLGLVGITPSGSQTNYDSVATLILQLFITAFLPAFFEEFTHRGLLYAGYGNLGYRYVLVSGFLFCLMHQNISQFAFTFLDGSIIALTVFYTGSIFSGMFIHLLNNTVVTLGEYAAQNGGAFSFIHDAQVWLTQDFKGYLVYVLLAAVATGLLLGIFYYLRRDAIKKGRLPDQFVITGNTEVLPLSKDAYFIATIVIGIIAVAFSLIWGVLR